MTARDDAARAGKAAHAALSGAQEAVLAAMTREAALAVRGTVPPALARRKVADATAVELGRASAQLRQVYARAVRDVTGGDGPLPDAPAQVATAVLRAQHDAEVAFGAVLAAALGPGNGVRMPPPSSPYRRIVTSAARAGTPGKAAAAALGAIGARGLTGWVSYQGRRVPLTAYGQRVVKAATVHLARLPVLSQVTARRDALLAVHERSLAVAWHAEVATLSPSAAVAAFRAGSRLTGTADPAVARRWRQEAATAAATAWLAGERFPALTGALEGIAREGMAEGEADAMAFAAQKQRVAGFSAAAAYASARERLAGDMAVARQAQDARERLAAAAVAVTARALAGAREDAGEGEAGESIQEALRNPATVSRWADRALWAALGAGTLRLYQRAAARQFTGQGVMISWQASASACPVCLANMAGSPYAPVDVPPFPAHGSCRCDLLSDSDLPLSMLAQFAGLL